MNESSRGKIIANSIPEPNSGCWLWEKSIGSHGYGNFCIDGQIMTAPRASARAFICSEIPKGKLVLHKCDNRLCVNPAHLEIGSASDNMRQASERGRIRNQYRKMFSDASSIAKIKADPRKQRDIASDYGVSQTLVNYIKTGRRSAWAGQG